MAHSRYVNQVTRRILVIFTGAAATILSACAVAFEPNSLSGNVRLQDGKPAVDTYVVGTWTGATPIAGSHSCYRLIVGQTDGQGRYRLVVKTKQPNVVDVDAEAFAFKAGHMPAKTNEDASGLLIGPPATDKKAYFDYVFDVTTRLFCDRNNWGENNVYPLARVLVKELSVSATSPDEVVISRRMAKSLLGEAGQ